MKDLKEITKKFLTSLNIKKAHILGHSMGGLIGLLLAEEYPELVKSFINGNPMFLLIHIPQMVLIINML